ncbi:MAG: HisA/HisF-related TIM barrel protein, partial [Candidatus Omnitrophica bacterium]|nr:HisA/HisF-related TIM barrel protein [Candidatus Omnitrophota bacterium]
MLVIPAIDIKEGKVVRLERGDFQKPTLYFDNPLEAAVYWENEGAEFLHIVDLDGAREGAPKNLNLIKEIARKIKVPIQAGGGIRTRKEIDQLLQSGIERVIVGTKACADRDWLRKIGEDFSGRIVVSLDVKDDFLAVEGWLKGTALKPVEFVENLKGLGVDTFIF